MSVDALLDSLHVSLQNSFAIMKLVQIAEEREAFVTESQETTTKISPSSESGTDKNLPPYYALIYIIKT